MTAHGQIGEFHRDPESWISYMKQLECYFVAIVDRSKQATVIPAYKLKNYGEKLARYSYHLTFLASCHTHGIILNGLRWYCPSNRPKLRGSRRRLAKPFSGKASQTQDGRRHGPPITFCTLSQASRSHSPLNNGHTWTNSAKNLQTRYTVW